MNGVELDFYKIGGTLPPDAPSYIIRKADDELYEGLREGRFCYVLTSRQMGKSSLRNRTAQRLRDSGIAVAELDLTGIGRNLTPEQWYDGLVYELGRELGIKAQLNACWRANANLGPLHRLMCVLQEGVLSQLPGRVIIFIDEIEVVRSPSFSFSADEFFAAIRACYNLRSSQSTLQRLSFCLLGMAAPADLIQDARITPFNIGLRIELTDFTAEEAKPLARGLCAGGRDGEMLLERVLHWTGGHPYLTQRLCQAVAEHPEVLTSWGVDELCVDLFLTTRARESEANLVPVREYLLKNSGDIAGTLDLYQRVLFGKRVEDDETNPLVRTLCLSGITRVENGLLWVRNPIYAHVFDRKWIAANMPDAEIRRQKRAYRKGALRAAAIASIIIAVMTGLIWEAITERDRANQQEKTTNRLLYVGDMYAAQSALTRHDVERALSLLKYHDNYPQRGFEYGYLWRQSHLELFTSNGLTATVYSVAFSPDSRLVAMTAYDGTVDVFETAHWSRVQDLKVKLGLHQPVYAIAFSPDGNYLAFAGEADTLSVIDTRTWQTVTTHSRLQSIIHTMMFSPDGKWLALAGDSGTVEVWSTTAWRWKYKFGEGQGPLRSIAFSPDGRMLATGGAYSQGNRGELRFWNMSTGRALRSPMVFDHDVFCLAFSPDGQWLGVGGQSRAVDVLSANTFQHRRTLNVHALNVYSMSFSPDSRRLALACDDRTVKICSLASDKDTHTIDGHTAIVDTVSFSPDGRWIASGGWDDTMRVWEANWEQKDRIALQGYDPTIQNWIFSHDSTRLATVNQHEEIQVWDSTTGKKVGKKLRWKGDNPAITFYPDNRRIVLAANKNRLWVYDPQTSHVTNTITTPMPLSRVFAFSRDGNWLAAGVDHSVYLWKIGSTEQPRVLPALLKPASSLTFSADGKQLAAGCSDHHVTVWLLKDSRPPLQFEVHGDQVNSVAFSRDGLSLVTGSVDSIGGSKGTVSLWNLATQREALTWSEDENPEHTIFDEGPAVAFSADGHVLATIEGPAIVLRRSSPAH